MNTKQQNNVSCRITAALIKYLQKRGYDYSLVYHDMPYTTDFLLNPRKHIPEADLNIMVERSAQMTHNEKIMLEIGQTAPVVPLSKLHLNLIKFFGSPRVAFDQINHYGHLFNPNIRLRVDMIDSQSALIRLNQDQAAIPSRHACYCAQGILSEIPRLWNLPAAEINELYCACGQKIPENRLNQGESSDCLYEVKWQNRNNARTRIFEAWFSKRTGTHNTITAMERNYRLLDAKNSELILQNSLLAKIREIAISIDSTDSVEQIYQNMIEQCRDIPGVGFALLLKIDCNNNDVSIMNYSKIRNPELIAKLKQAGIDIEADPNNGLREYLHLSPLQTKNVIRLTKCQKILYVDRLSQLLDGVWPAALSDEVQRLTGFKQYIMMPLAVDENNWVGIHLSLATLIPRDILEMLKSHTFSALKNAHTLETLGKRNQELSAVNSIAGEIVQSLDINHIIERAVQEVIRVFNANSACLHMLDEISGGLKLAGQRGMPEHILQKSQSVDSQHPYFQFLISDQELFCGKMPENQVKYIEVTKSTQAENPLWFMTSIIVIDGKREGTLTILRSHMHGFRDEEKSLLRSISNHLAIAFENARLHQHLLLRIKDLENAKNVLSESDEKMRLTLDSVSEAIMVASLDGKIMRANKAASRMHGYERNEDFVGKSSLMYVVFEERRRMLESLKKIKETGVFRKAEYTLVKKDGSTFETECSISVFRNFLGIPEGFVICIRDISARKTTEKRLIENERRYRLIAENTNDFITLLTFGGYYSYVSPSYRRLGYEPTELINKPGLDLIHPDDKKMIIPILLKFSQMGLPDLARMKKEGAAQKLEYRVKDKSGNWHNLDATGNIIETQDGRGYMFLLISRDVTERKKAADELRDLYVKEKTTSQALAQEINKRADFFRALVHELKTPLTPILVSSETLKDLAPDRIFQNLAGNVYNSAMRLNNRIDELMDISRGEMGLLKLNLDPVNISLLIKDVVSYIQPQVAQNQQILITQIQDDLPQIQGEEMRIRQVILNLLDNAMKFTPENGQIFLEAMADSDNIMVKVRDTGRGINDMDKDRIFQPYNRIESDRQHFSGLGLGLALCKQFINLHGGRLWIESQKNQGTTFFFTLPVLKGAQNLPEGTHNLTGEKSVPQK